MGILRRLPVPTIYVLSRNVKKFFLSANFRFRNIKLQSYNGPDIPFKDSTTDDGFLPVLYILTV